MAPHAINGCSAGQEAIGTLDMDVVEMPLLLAADQAAALESAAFQHGLTVAQMTRRLIENFLQRTSLLSPKNSDAS
jgi:hypothetical protein